MSSAARRAWKATRMREKIPAFVSRGVQEQRRKWKKPVEKFRRWRIVLGDDVQIISGRDKGKQGKVLKVMRKTNRVLVEDCNLRGKMVKITEDEPAKKIMMESSLHVSNVALVDPASGLPTKAIWRWNAETGEKFRASKKSGAEIPKPLEARMRSSPRKEVDGPKDTRPEDLLAVTFKGLNIRPLIAKS